MREADRENLMKCNDVFNALRYYIFKVEELEEANEKLRRTKRIKTYNDIQKNFISKDRIRNKIEELEEIEKQFEFINNDSYARKRNKDFIKVLKALLEE